MAKPVVQKIKLVSTAGTGYYYVTKKNPRNLTEKMVMKKYDPVARKHVEFKEAKIKRLPLNVRELGAAPDMAWPSFLFAEGQMPRLTKEEREAFSCRKAGIMKIAVVRPDGSPPDAALVHLPRRRHLVHAAREGGMVCLPATGASGCRW